VEYAVVDRAGRLQIPAGLMSAEGFRNARRVRVEMENGRIVLYPPDEEKSEAN